MLPDVTDFIGLRAKVKIQSNPVETFYDLKMHIFVDPFAAGSYAFNFDFLRSDILAAMLDMGPEIFTIQSLELCFLKITENDWDGISEDLTAIYEGSENEREISQRMVSVFDPFVVEAYDVTAVLLPPLLSMTEYIAANSSDGDNPGTK